MVKTMGLPVVSSAEVVALDPAGPGGDLTVIEAVAPLAAPLTYVSGGNGLTGDGCWPALCLPPATPAQAANAYDHRWLQYDPAIIWSSPNPLNQVFAIPGIDHGPLPGEALEFLIEGSNDGGVSWTTGTILAIYRDGFDTANTTLGHSDDYTSLWGFTTSYTLFRAVSGDLVEGFSSPGEGMAWRRPFQSRPPFFSWDLAWLG